MRDPAALLADLVAAGLPAALIAEVAELAVEVRTLFKRRASDAERKRKSRANACHVTSQDVTGRVSPLSSTTTTEEVVIPLRKKEREARGTRLDPNWALPEVDKQFALQAGLKEREVVFEAAKFRDYWVGKAGAAAAKLNWSCTWRNWVRYGLERNHRASSLTGSPRPGSKEDRSERTANALLKLREYRDDPRRSHNPRQQAGGFLPFPEPA